MRVKDIPVGRKVCCLHVSGGGTGPPNPSPVNPVYVGIKPKIPRDPI